MKPLPKKICFTFLSTLAILVSFVINPALVFAFANNPPEIVGPELAFFDRTGQEDVNNNVLVPNTFSGPDAAVQVINLISEAPYNPVSDKTTDVTLRIAGIQPDTPLSQVVSYAQQLNASNAFSDKTKTIVIFGNEDNSLDKEYIVPGATKNNESDLRAAARQYGLQYITFARTIDHSKFRVAPAPPDLYNGDWNPIPWVSEFSNYLNANGGCSVTDTLVANVFDVPSRVGTGNLDTYKYLEDHICSGLKVERFGGWGAWPGSTVKDQVDFLDNTQLPPGIKATTLIVPNCNGEGTGIPDPSQGWWYYIRGEVFKADGTKVDPANCQSQGTEVTLSSKPIPKPYVACDQVRPDTENPDETEFHSLRPYEASPCVRKVEQTIRYCGNNFYAKETFDLQPGQFGSHCDPPDASGNVTCYDFGPIKSFVNVDIRLDPAELPILGNTQLVPNAINKTNVLDSATRMNNYVSWFLNGALYQFEDALSPTVKDILNFSGPIRKLFPQIGIETLKLDQKIQAGQARHNQQVTADQRITDANLNSKYLPLASTEDKIGEVAVENKYPSGGFGGNTFFLKDIQFKPDVIDGQTQNVDDIYFAHTEETAQLASDLQSTFASKDAKTFSETYDFNQPPARVSGFCDIQNYRTNPGDDLFGDYNDATNPDHKYLEKITGTFEYTTDVYHDPVTFSPKWGVDQACVDAGGDNETCKTQVGWVPQKRYAYMALYVYTKSPKIKEIWERLVDGASGVAKRFFPQDIVTEMGKKENDIPAAVSAIYDATINPSAQGNGVEAIAGQPFVPKSGDDALLFVPHLGSVQDYFLQGIQCALRPKGMCGNSTLQSPAGAQASEKKTTCVAPAPYSEEESAFIDQAITKGGAAAEVPKSILEAIYSIEGFEPYYSQSYDCKKNSAGALGLMQVTDGILNSVTTPVERATDEEGNCGPIEGKLNRCYPPDAVELAARVLLLKISKYSNGQPTGSINNKDEVYRAAYGYYGCYDPDKMTNDRGNDVWSSTQGPVPDNQDGYTNYSEVVCARSGYCRSSSDYPWPRPADSCNNSPTQ